MGEKIEVFVYRSRWFDWLRSTGLVATVGGLSVVNHRWGGGSPWIDALAVILFFLTLIALVHMKTREAYRGTIDEAITHLESLKNER